MSMSDDDFIEYCNIHSDSPQALFHRDQVLRMYQLAGIAGVDPDDCGNMSEFITMQESMKQLVKHARFRRRSAANGLEELWPDKSAAVIEGLTVLRSYGPVRIMVYEDNLCAQPPPTADLTGKEIETMSFYGWKAGRDDWYIELTADT